MTSARSDTSPEGYDRCHAGWGNAELQYYTSETANAALDGAGSLVITAARPGARLAATRYDGCQYTRSCAIECPAGDEDTAAAERGRRLDQCLGV